MGKAKYCFQVRESKAIGSADIELDTITVLTGVNACGKRTLARMIHEIVNLSAIYHVLLRKYAWLPLKNWAMHIAQLKDRLENKGVVAYSAASLMMNKVKFESELERYDLQIVLAIGVKV